MAPLQQMGNASDRGNFLKYRNREERQNIVEKKKKKFTGARCTISAIEFVIFDFSCGSESRDGSCLNDEGRSSPSGCALGRLLSTVADREPWFLSRRFTAEKSLTRGCVTGLSLIIDRKCPSRQFVFERHVRQLPFILHIGHYW